MEVVRVCLLACSLSGEHCQLITDNYPIVGKMLFAELQPLEEGACQVTGDSDMARVQSTMRISVPEA